MELLLSQIIEGFDFQGEFLSNKEHEVGNINDTFIVKFKEEDKINKYIIQRINKNVFKNPKKLMENIRLITTHIVDKVKLTGGDIERESLNIIKTKEEKDFFEDHKGQFWRSYKFIEGAKTYMQVEEPKHLYETGKALGKFQKQLDDFDAKQLYEVIKDFHNTPKRYRDFLESINNDKADRASKVSKEIDFIMARADDFSKLMNLLYDKKIPLRVTHNDTKFNNIMIDKITGKAICVIDLDTVMPGISLYDFGDAIRSGAATAVEDEIDLNKVTLDIQLYEGFVKGLLEESSDILNEYEIDNLAFSAKLITMELAMRFLTDYLNGDTYFKIIREHHNLERARNQMKLAYEIEKNIDIMNEIVKKYC